MKWFFKIKAETIFLSTLIIENFQPQAWQQLFSILFLTTNYEVWLKLILLKEFLPRKLITVIQSAAFKIIDNLWNYPTFSPLHCGIHTHWSNIGGGGWWRRWHRWWMLCISSLFRWVTAILLPWESPVLRSMWFSLGCQSLHCCDFHGVQLMTDQNTSPSDHRDWPGESHQTEVIQISVLSGTLCRY